MLRTRAGTLAWFIAAALLPAAAGVARAAPPALDLKPTFGDALVPGRWQVAVEGFTNFISDMMDTNIGPKAVSLCPMSSRCSCSSCSPT